MEQEITTEEFKQFLHEYWTEGEIGKEIDKIFADKESLWNHQASLRF